jgi:peptidoglycan/xylan/chitin deacetylase (PgdA/CDA1 family)
VPSRIPLAAWVVASVLAFGVMTMAGPVPMARATSQPHAPATTPAAWQVPAPTELRGARSPEGAAQLDWQAVDGATHYVVQRNGKPIASVESTSYTDWAGGRLGGTHEYTVRAVDGEGGIGEPSNKVRIRVDPARYSWAGTTVRSSPQQRPQVALTFDDCYGVTRVEEIAEVLRRNGASATFFCAGQAVAASPAIFAALVPEFELANHTWSHPQLNHLTRDRIVAEITSATDVIERVTGAEMMPLLRAPGGRSNSVTRQALRDMGVVVVKWDIDTLDWNRSVSSEQVRDRALAARNGSIVLMHTKAKTVRALPAVIKGLQDRGFELVTVSELLGVPPADRQPTPGSEPSPVKRTPRPWTGWHPV